MVDAIGPAPAPCQGARSPRPISRSTVDPIVEWRQIFDEAWRIERDYLYVANLNGADWPAIKKKYEVFLPYVRHRADLTTLLSQMQGELTVGHSFVGGGDLPKADALPAGLLGADYEVANGRYRIAKIYRGENWNPSLRAPLSAPGVDVHAGDYILERERRRSRCRRRTSTRRSSAPWASRCSSASTAVRSWRARISSPSCPSPARWRCASATGSRGIAVRWIRSRDGELAYVYIPDTGEGGYTNFNRYYFAQQNKKGAVIDERFNHGGSIADYMVDIMTRQLHGYFSQRLGDRYTAVTAPAAAIWGPKVLIINEMSGSGGDMFPYMFREMHVGPLIGTKTWGGLVGWGGEPRFVDGGFISAPSTGFYNPDGQWDVENKGVAPDIQVEQTPAARNRRPRPAARARCGPRP